jgi:acetyl-CoA carboxylase carboxyltransferase component
VTKEELGGADLHTTVSGVADDAFDSEPDLFAGIRRFLSYLPSNVWERPPVIPCDDPADRREDELLSIVPRERRRPYRMRRAPLEERLLAFRNPFLTVESFALEELIDPRDTRPLLCDLLRQHRETAGPPVGPKYLVRP